MAGAIALTAIERPRIAAAGTRWVDLAIVATLAAIAAQLVPLAPAVREAISPAARAFEQQMLVGTDVTASARPISIDPTETRTALAFAVAMALTFWSTRAALGRGGVRTLARAVATIGLVLAPLAVVDHMAFVPTLDAVWPVTRSDLRPWGPFVNRNDFAAWLLLGTALTLGYLVTRLEARHRAGEPLDPDRAFDETGTRLATAVCLMTAGVMVSLSRSGLLGVAAGLTLFFLLGRHRLSASRQSALIAAVVAVLAIGALFANAGAMSSRLQLTMAEGLTGRLSLWRQTWPVVHDFWMAGCGVGAYPRAMALYQTSTRLITIVHADNEPLQIAAEGGLLVALPFAIALLGFARLVRLRLRGDRTAMFWMRAGAVSGLAAVAVQNLLEMTLRVPANAILAVALAAVATHAHTDGNDRPSHAHAAGI